MINVIIIMSASHMHHHGLSNSSAASSSSFSEESWSMAYNQEADWLRRLDKHHFRVKANDVHSLLLPTGWKSTTPDSEAVRCELCTLHDPPKSPQPFSADERGAAQRRNPEPEPRKLESQFKALLCAWECRRRRQREEMKKVVREERESQWGWSPTSNRWRLTFDPCAAQPPALCFSTEAESHRWAAGNSATSCEDRADEPTTQFTFWRSQPEGCRMNEEGGATQWKHWESLILESLVWIYIDSSCIQQHNVCLVPQARWSLEGPRRS